MSVCASSCSRSCSVVDRRMFENTPSVRQTFEKFRELDDEFPASEWLPRGQLASSDVLRTHGMVVMNALDEIISSLDENSEVVELILEQGRSHARFGDDLTAEAFWVYIAVVIFY